MTADLAAWRAYSTVHTQLAAHLSRELTRATGLSEADYQVLDALLDAPGGRMRALELRWVLQWEKSRLSHQVGRMAKRGLLGRESCAEDARGWDIALTPEGREAAVRARQVRDDSVRRLVLDALGPDRLAGLEETAALLSARLERAAEEDPSCRAARAEVFPGAPSVD
ncbi:MarR family winged helix-turn-helix transcriptional regulator [Nonomuraea sp. C10]|uniref:MarR family winged helix-turn-helix transcriptional regulator n=1 Tax=Nonomuraea sp. C10 TaxID=2600577 RepID=UPI0011CEA65D|nr:MarR family winged helix-turn-helix transcriptional regulator [Nonomuraea sp. C10]TXK42477.1 winged helix-turn-helix transcriptional regulator [Nonomuraea sp. C10]